MKKFKIKKFEAVKEALENNNLPIAFEVEDQDEELWDLKITKIISHFINTEEVKWGPSPYNDYGVVVTFTYSWDDKWDHSLIDALAGTILISF